MGQCAFGQHCQQCQILFRAYGQKMFFGNMVQQSALKMRLDFKGQYWSKLLFFFNFFIMSGEYLLLFRVHCLKGKFSYCNIAMMGLYTKLMGYSLSGYLGQYYARAQLTSRSFGDNIVVGNILKFFDTILLGTYFASL